ncbi:MAG: hypothetical protein ACPGWR_05090 [Ardenticatenaceae bacterium]
MTIFPFKEFAGGGERLPQKIIRGYRLYVIKDQDGLDNNISADSHDCKAVTGGQFPFAFALLQPFDENPENFEDLMIPWGFVRCHQRIIPWQEAFPF